MSSKISRREKETTLKDFDQFCSKLHVNCPYNLYNNTINNNSKPYPSSTRIKKLNSKKHALYGRPFENSMICYDVRNCDCCRKVCINNDDNLLEKEKYILLNDLI